MKSALFVDFDNVFSQLRQLQPDAAERFARHPGEWIAWLTGSLELPEPHEDSERRRLLVRRCYLNPNWYQTYRHAFLRAGFEIVDCPPVTSQGKTSTDIHMVLDIIELLQHETRCDEFIVFSADADFTPVLRKLRRYDRRTTVLAIGFPSAAYQASADLLIDERLFLKEALRFGPAGSEISMPPGGPTQDAGDVRPPDTKQANAEVSPAPAAVNAGKPDASTKTTPRLATAEELSVVATRIWATLDDSSLPISAGLLASRLRQEHPDIMDNWNGNGTFKAFFRSLGLSRLIWVTGAGGKILDPCRHDVDIAAVEQDPESPWSANGETFNVIREVCVLTGAPMLSPQDLRLVINTLAQVLAERGFESATTAQQVCRRCLDTHGVRVRQRDITFLVRGMQMNGHVFGQGKDDEATLAARLVNQVLFLCEREQKVLNTNEIVHIAKWINVEPVLSM
jgi:hypothetical protein